MRRGDPGKLGDKIKIETVELLARDLVEVLSGCSSPPISGFAVSSFVTEATVV